MAEEQSESTVQNAGQVLAEQIEEAIRPLANCVTAVLRVDENNELELIGSAVLIEVSGEVFFCSAKHVIDLCTTGVFVDAPLKNEALNGNFITSEEHDLAVLKLSPEQVKLFAKYQPLSVHFVGNHAEASQCKYAQFIGFPETKNRRRHGQIDTKGLIYPMAVPLRRSASPRSAWLSREGIVLPRERAVNNLGFGFRHPRKLQNMLRPGADEHFSPKCSGVFQVLVNV